MHYQPSPLAFETKPASCVRGIPDHSLPVRVAIIGNHLPRQCGIATFTTDLCDAIAAEYGAAGVSVVAVNDPNPRYSCPARFPFEVSAPRFPCNRAAPDFLNSSHVDRLCLQHEYRRFAGK